MKRFTAEQTDKMQSFLDEEGQSDFVCLTDRNGAQLEITYKGAHAARPADLLDVDGFVGVKSHRAKGKRLTTYDVATLRFIEPELPETPAEPELSDDSEPFDMFDASDAGETQAADGVSGASGVVMTGSADLEIERPRGDADQMLDPEQLDLF